MTQPNLQMLTTGVGVLSGDGGEFGFSTYQDFKLVKRYLYGKLDGSDNVTNGEVELFTPQELQKILAIIAKVNLPVLHFRVFQKSFGGGLAVVAGVGTWVGMPSLEHLNMLQAMRVVSREISPISTEAEWSIVEDLYGRSERNDAELLELIKSYTEEQALQVATEIRAARIPAEMVGVPEGIDPAADPKIAVVDNGIAKV